MGNLDPGSSLVESGQKTLREKAGEDWIAAIDRNKAYSNIDAATFRKYVKRTKSDNLFKAISRNVSAGDTVLEAGCGWGCFSFALAEQGVRVVALDISEKLINDLRHIQKELGGRCKEFLELAAGDLFLLHKFGRQFNVIFSNGTYQHFLESSDRTEMLKIFHRHLTSKGKCIISVPNTGNVFLKMLIAKEDMPSIHHFDLKKLRRELEAGDFDVLETGYKFVDAGFEQWLNTKWLAGLMRFISHIFSALPRVVQRQTAPHIYCVAQKRS